MARDNSAGYRALDEMILALKSLETAPKELAPRAAEAFDAEIRAQIARGEDPAGKPWKPTLEGEKPLKTAGNALKVAASGAKVVATLTGHVAMHHLGIAKGRVKRAILPTRRLPDAVVRALRALYVRMMHEKFGGG